MKVENVNGQRVLTPSENMYLYNVDAKVISDKVYLGKDANEKAWAEITEEAKIQLEAEWETEDYQEETKSDEEYAEAGKILLGVSE